jgi:peptide/nickel transport system permease protein
MTGQDATGVGPRSGTGPARMPRGALAILAGIAIVAVLCPWIAPYPPEVGRLSDRLRPPFWLAGGSLEHLLGTDHLGRDLLSRTMWGARVSVSIGFLSVGFAGLVGTAVGLAAGFRRGWTDTYLMGIADVALSMPLMLMAITLVAMLGASFRNVVLVVILLLWPYYARQVRGEALALRELEFVTLARIANCSDRRIMLRHILPNLMPTVLVLSTLQVGYVILLEASLSFLGVGIPPPTPAWGLMVSEGQELIGSAWWVALWPGLAIFVTVLAGNLVGDWMRDRFDPRLSAV